jgi:hypothetical protein
VQIQVKGVKDHDNPSTFGERKFMTELGKALQGAALVKFDKIVLLLAEDKLTFSAGLQVCDRARNFYAIAADRMHFLAWAPRRDNVNYSSS